MAFSLMSGGRLMVRLAMAVSFLSAVVCLPHAMRAETAPAELKVQRVASVPNGRHPQIVYWFWDRNTIKDGRYEKDLERMANESPFTLVFLTARVGPPGFHDPNAMHGHFQATVKKAHELGLKVGLQLWAPYQLNSTSTFEAPLEEAQARHVRARVHVDRHHAAGPSGAQADGADGRVEPGRDGQTVDVRVPMEFKVRGGRKEIVLPPDAATAADVGPRSPLIVALARAHRWQRMLETRETPSLDEIAKSCGVDRSYVGRIIRLTSLAPAVIQTLVAGEQPSAMTLNALAKDVPMEWERQLESLGYPTTAARA